MRGAQAIADTAVDKIDSPPKTGRIYRSKGNKKEMHQASAPGEAPAGDTNELGGGISTRLVESTSTHVIVEAGAKAPYAVALELGTPKMEPRPFMTPAYRENREDIRRSVERTVARAIERNARGRR